jgi:hypothetical protein
MLVTTVHKFLPSQLIQDVIEESEVGWAEDQILGYR